MADNRLTIMRGDCRELLKQLPDGAVNCCVTSPPYWGLRDYGHAGQIGQEKTPAEFVEALVQVFREVRRVLREDGTLWLNLGDSYSTHASGKCIDPMKTSGLSGVETQVVARLNKEAQPYRNSPLAEKNLIGIPWRVALALQADGWWLRSDIIWAKQNCMPESVTDRPTRSHEYIFLLTKSPKYYYDAEAIKEPCVYDTGKPGTSTADRKARQKENSKSMPTDERNGLRPQKEDKQRGHSRKHSGFNERWDAMEKKEQCSGMRNKRDVWTVAPANYKGAHFATYPPALIKPCILAGCPSGGVVLDPFGGSGTTGEVALELGRRAILMELNPEYAALADKRCSVTYGLNLEGRAA